MDINRKHELENTCEKMRLDIMRMAKAAGDSGMHFGGSLSLIEILCALYFECANTYKKDTFYENRDRVILSKGHGVPALYAVWSQLGIIEPSELDTFKNDKTRLFGHPHIDEELRVDYSSGSLGQGLSLGVGTALGLRHKGSDARTYVILGDGECDEGSVWEAAMSANQFRINNLMAIVDCNGLQYDGETDKIMSLGDISNKWKSFGWDVVEIDGHDIEACCEALNTKSDIPVVIIAKTIKGKGISFMENDPTWHHKKLSIAQETTAYEELNHA